MNPDKQRALTNHFLDVRLVSLSSWRFAREIEPRDSAGPYMIAQEGYAPEDLHMRLGEFVLGRSGQWLAVATLLKLPVATRRAEFVFGTSAEVMQLFSTLPTKVSMWSSDIAPPPDGPTDTDDFHSAFGSAGQDLPP
jgi:hypothetical protein